VSRIFIDASNLVSNLMPTKFYFPFTLLIEFTQRMQSLSDIRNHFDQVHVHWQVS